MNDLSIVSIRVTDNPTRSMPNILETKMPKKLLLLLVLLQFLSCSSLKPIPQPRSEFRGVWIATVVNIDWPKNGNDDILKQKADYRDILDFYQGLNFNAAIVQVRTAGDAFYSSKYAPWSRYLTGEEGRPPNTDTNLLTWMIDEAHLRGMEFHAWLNPYRSTFDLKTDILSPTHDFNLHPEWMLKYGNKYYYDPGLPEVRQRMSDIVAELVTDYDVDAVHFDDYFYPYTIKDEVFNDSLTYDYHHLPSQSLEDWRRSNIDSLVMHVHQTIKSKKPWVQFGISPFGVWKNKSTDPRGSDTQAGQTTYEDLYADPLLWMEEGWLDYIVPQVYWSMALPVASHRVIVDWWAAQPPNTNLYIGNGPYKIRNNSDVAWDDKKELPTQLTYARTTKAVQGNVFFSAKSLMYKHSDIVAKLKRKYYRNAALPPSSKLAPPMEKRPLTLNSVVRKNDSLYLDFENLAPYRYAMVYPTGKKLKAVYPIKKVMAKLPVIDRQDLRIPISLVNRHNTIALVFIDLFGRENEPFLVHLNQINASGAKR